MDRGGCGLRALPRQSASGGEPFKSVDIHALPKVIFPSGQPCLEGKMTFGEPFEDSGVVGGWVCLVSLQRRAASHAPKQAYRQGPTTDGWVGSQLRKKCLVEMCSGSEEGSHLRLIDFCITQV